MKFTLLWSDGAFLSFVIICAVWFFTALRRVRAREILHTVFARPVAVCSAIILACFLIIGVLDSIHFTVLGNLRVVSLLDRILAPLDNIDETTYSKPLALQSYLPEYKVEQKNVAIVFPKLNYPQPYFADDIQRNKFILQSIWQSIIIASIIAAAIASIWFGKLYMVKGLRPPTSVFWTAILTLWVCLMVGILCYFLSRELHIFGTGKIGEDVFYYGIKSIRTALIIGLLTSAFMIPFALLFGILAGYFGGIVDDIIQFIYTTLSSVPSVLLITAFVLSMQAYIANHPQAFSNLGDEADVRLLALCGILGLTSWTNLCRLLRAETLKLRELDFITAAYALGSSVRFILFKHIVPNLIPLVLISMVLDFSFLVLSEAVLSYVGVGVSPLTMSFGNMINAARLELARDPIVWWPMFAAFILMFTLVICSNLLADNLRDALDPREV